MTAAPTVSLVIVSNARPKSLARLLQSLRHQTMRRFQTIVVTDAPADAVGRAEHVPFEDRNISAARNAGIARALSDVVAFCDDDAVPEPAWLERLTAPFSDATVGAAGGFIRNRNGVAFQSKAVAVDMCGRDIAVDADVNALWTCPDPPEGHVLKTTGTNCAFRLSALLAVGGFDEAMRFYLEEADLNVRMAQAGWRTAIVPSAEVHHGAHAGPHRSAAGVPKDLFEIGASLARFLHKYAEPEQISETLAEFRAQRRRGLERFQAKGRLRDNEVRSLMRRLEEGFVAGVRRGRAGFPKTPFVPAQGCWPEPVAPASRRIALLARPFRRRVAQALARHLVASGRDVTLIDFRPELRFLTVRYLSSGYWLHRGGSFGRGVRSGPLVRAATIRQRCAEELQRIAGQRRFDAVHEVTAWTKQSGLREFVQRSGGLAPPVSEVLTEHGVDVLTPTLR